MTLKKAFLFFCALGILTLGGAEKAGAVDSLDFASIKVQTLAQIPTSLKENFTGELLLLDFWASWCGPCKDSLPYYEKLQQRYASQGLKILAVSVDDEVKDATAFIAKNKYSLTFLWDKNRVLAKSLDIKAIPTTLLLDKTGKVLHQERGFLESSKATFEQQILKALKKPTSP